MPISEAHQPRLQIYNRLTAFMVHIPWYTIEGQRRLAADCHCSCSTISRLQHNQLNPSYRLAKSVTDAVSRRLGYALDMAELFSTTGAYPTPSVCSLTGCPGCFPPFAFADDGSLLESYRDLKPGDWCRFRPVEPIEPLGPQSQFLTFCQ
jgi:hypothetical protein